uniref:Uncharacterized protein n=2 Tax=Oryza TaxID=4527 RepID=A0A0D3H590_9ORYZ
MTPSSRGWRRRGRSGRWWRCSTGALTASVTTRGGSEVALEQRVLVRHQVAHALQLAERAMVAETHELALA